MIFNLIKLGHVYRAIDDVKAMGMVILKAPGSGGFDCVIPNGTKIVVEDAPWFFAKAFYATPLNYKEIEKKIVPIKEINSPLYNFYTLVVRVKDIKKYFIKEEINEIVFDDDMAQQRWNQYFKKDFDKNRK